MGRTTKYIVLWVGATTLTVTLSWLGVHGVLRTVVFEQPTAVSAPTGDRTPAGTGSGVRRQGPHTPTSTSTSSPGRARTLGAAARPTPSVDSVVRGVDMRGGRAVLSVGGDSVRLMSAVPASGYRTEVSRNIGWLRVDFISSERYSSVIASWYRQAPTINVYER